MRTLLNPAYRVLELAHGYAVSQWLAKPTTDRFRSLIRRHMKLGPDAKLLDIGCGVGNYRNDFECDYCGVDVNDAYIEKAKSTLQGRFLVMDCTRLKFKDQTFDHIVCLATTHHLDDEQVVLMVREALRVCKPSGQVHIFDAILPVSPNFAFKRFWFRLDRGAHPRSFDHLIEIVEKAGHVSAREIVTGPLHDVTYIAVTPTA